MTDTLSRIITLWPQTPTVGPSPREIAGVGRDDLAWAFARLGFTRGVEVGTERGLYAQVLCECSLLCETNPGLVLHCVDPWLAYGDYREHVSQSMLDAFYDEAVTNLMCYGVNFHREFSVDAAKSFVDGSLDFVYLDGNHNLLHVVQDLYAWLPKIRKGGIIAGHDFIRRRKGRYNAEVHVVEAVTAYTQAHHVEPWYVLGTKAQVEGQTRDSARSWFWIKE